MPFVIEKRGCPAAKPYGVYTEGTDHLHGCHASEDEAKKQQAALYANVPDANSEESMPEGDPKERKIDLHLDVDGAKLAESLLKMSPKTRKLIEARKAGRLKAEEEAKAWDRIHELAGEHDAEKLTEANPAEPIKVDEAMILADSSDPELQQRKAKFAMLDGTVERRDFAAEEMELREISNGKLKLTGYASVTETPYDVMDFSETIARGAFKRTLSNEPDVVLLLNHEGLPLARTKSGTLTLSEDVRGLHVDAELEPSDPDVQALRPKMERGDLSEMSFAFRAVEQDWSEDYTKRTIREVSVHRGDVSMVTHGANSATSGNLSVRSEDAEEEKPKRPPRVKASYVENAKAKRAHYRRYR